MNLNNFLFKNNNGKPSVTLTAFVIGFLTCCLKLIFSGVILFGVTLAPFSGSDFAVAVGSIGAIYVFRKKDTDGVK